MIEMHTIDGLKDHIEQKVEISGWLNNIRSSGQIAFLIIRDGTGFIQCIAVRSELGDETYEIIKGLFYEDTLKIKGTVKISEKAPGGIEILMENIEVIHQYSQEEYPIQKKEHGIDFLMNNRHLWLRSKKQFAVIRIRDEIIKGIRDYLYENGFVLLDSPILTPTAPEGTSTLFETDYFGERAFLSQSGQLYQEVGALAFRKTYCFGPTFRAERSKTKKHLTEFWMVEPEIAFADLNDVMNICEEMICYVIDRVINKKKAELNILERDIEKLNAIKMPFHKITYSEAVEMVNQGGLSMKWGEDFGADEEDIISKKYDKPVFIHRYPKSIKPFYMEIDPENSDLVLNLDLIAPDGYGEIIGGSQRLFSLEKLTEGIKKANLNYDDYKWYIELRKWGNCLHSGFGLGIERFVAWICGIDHVRSAIPFPRTINRIYP